MSWTHRWAADGWPFVPIFTGKESLSFLPAHHCTCCWHTQGNPMFWDQPRTETSRRPLIHSRQTPHWTTATSWCSRCFRIGMGRRARQCVGPSPHPEMLWGAPEPRLTRPPGSDDLCAHPSHGPWVHLQPLAPRTEVQVQGSVHSRLWGHPDLPWPPTAPLLGKLD